MIFTLLLQKLRESWPFIDKSGPPRMRQKQQCIFTILQANTIFYFVVVVKIGLEFSPCLSNSPAAKPDFTGEPKMLVHTKFFYMNMFPGHF